MVEMLVAIISDTHDYKPFFERLGAILGKYGVDTAIHAGDHIAPFTVEWMDKAGLKMVYGVLGNNDGEYRLLHRRYEERKWILKDYVNIFELGGRRIAVTHGTDLEMPDILAETGRFDVVVYGHTHRKEVRRVGKTLVVNPGEGCGYLTGKSTMAILNLTTLEVEIIDV